MRISDWSSDVCSSDLSAFSLTGTVTVSEKALPVIRWHPLQWQAPVSIGGALMRKRSAPHRHPPSRGSVGIAITGLLPGAILFARADAAERRALRVDAVHRIDRKSTRLNSSH